MPESKHKPITYSERTGERLSSRSRILNWLHGWRKQAEIKATLVEAESEYGINLQPEVEQTQQQEVSQP